MPAHKEYIVIFGGSFNPPHLAHTAICDWLLNTHGADKVWIIPCFMHPFGKDLVPFERRFEMAKITFAGFGERVAVLDIERELGGVSYTIRTVEAILERYPEARFGFVVGGDIKGESDKWRDFDRLNDMVEMVMVPRGETSFIPNISATAIRERLASGEPVDDMISKEVYDYIKREGLYVKK